MAKRDTFLLRMDPAVMEALRRWSEDELRSMNGQIEFLLRQALLQSGRLGARPATGGPAAHAEEAEPPGPQ